MSDSALESQVCDEPSRKELQRLELILSGGIRRFIRIHLVFVFAPLLLLMPMAYFRWLLFNNIRYVLPGAMLVASCVIFGAFRQWRLSVARAAAIRAGASFAPPVDLKDHQIFLLSAVFLGLLSGMLSEGTFFSPGEFTRVGRLFLFIAALVFALWSLGKAILGYRICPPEHLRRPDLFGAILSSLFILLFLTLGAAMLTSLPAVVDFFVSRTTPNYLAPIKP